MCLSLSRVQLFETPWTVACQASLSTGFSRLEYWSGVPFPSPGGLPDPGTESRSPALQADSLPAEPPRKPREHISGYQWGGGRGRENIGVGEWDFQIVGYKTGSKDVLYNMRNTANFQL